MMIQIFCDGCGPRTLADGKAMGIGLYSNEIFSGGKVVFSENATSVFAEFLAIEAALSLCLQMNTFDPSKDTFKITNDCQYAINSILGREVVTKPHLCEVLDRIKALKIQLLRNGVVYSITFVPSKQNLADYPSRFLFGDKIKNPLPRFHSIEINGFTQLK